MDACSISQTFYMLDEPYAAGFYEYPERDRFFRLAHAQRCLWETMALPPYDGGQLYPCGYKIIQPLAVFPDFSYTFGVNWSLLDGKWPEAVLLLKEETDLLPNVGPDHIVGGEGYTHSIPRYDRIVREGLDSYEERVRMRDDGDFKDGLLEVLEGIRIYHRRALETVKAADAPKPLIAALEQVPFSPSRNLYEAMVAWNFIYYVDGCDNPGRLDADLIDFYRGEDSVAWLREFFIHVDQNNGWSSALGPDCNALTLQCLKAIHGLRRPSLELRITPDTPDEIWEAAVDALKTGCGQPAFYCEEGYQSALAERFPEIPKADLLRFNGGGCTETMLAGLSCVGSLDAGINLPLIFAPYLREKLSSYDDFTSFYNGLLEAITDVTLRMMDKINIFKKQRSEVRPQPVRTLLIDDCIDKGLDFNAGGARYYWSCINFAGLINVVDSLLAVRSLIYQNITYTAEQFLDGLEKQEPRFLQDARACPCYGMDNDDADALAADFTRQVYGILDQKQHWHGGRFLAASIQFATYADAGKGVAATPDGRAADEPLADSIGAIHGKDTVGPTAMLNSAAKLPLKLALGTPVLNIRLQKRHLEHHLRPLITGFFSQGGMQVQVSCISREDILDAMAHPEKHENLIVRIGGYSEYFNRLSPELKETVLHRTEFGERA